MQVIRHYFGAAPPKGAVEPLWPAINDKRHGYVPGLRYLPEYASTLHMVVRARGAHRAPRHPSHKHTATLPTHCTRQA